MFKYLNRLTELHCEQRHHKFINHNICKLIHLSSNLFIQNPKSKRKKEIPAKDQVFSMQQGNV